jgi:hypothetical protein
MNPVEEGDNQFAELFKAMPAARIGRAEDIVGAVLYLSSQAGVSLHVFLRTKRGWAKIRHRLMSMEDVFAWMEVACSWQTDSNNSVNATDTQVRRREI